jgi:deazaflavin-dependent oxidoreductase (nitroreductase family)
VINPKILRAVARGESNYAVVHHVGRRSGTTYQTPVEAYRTAEGILILLPYGPVTDWCRNVLAAGHCTVTVDGQDLALSAPEVVQAGVAEARVPADVARRWHRQGIAHYLWIRSVLASDAEAKAEPALASGSISRHD